METGRGDWLSWGQHYIHYNIFLIVGLCILWILGAVCGEGGRRLDELASGSVLVFAREWPLLWFSGVKEESISKLGVA